MNFLTGQILSFDKEYGQTSFQLVSIVRRMLTQKMGGRKIKVGHAGTLDPLATGVLTLCTGRATRCIEDLQQHTKEYVAELCLGATTPSYDRELPIDDYFPCEHIDREFIDDVMPRFVGDIMQVPPVFSAVKVNGDRAYDLAREGLRIELKPKPVHIESITIEEFRAPNYLRIRVVCGKGTYIRALARDIGLALGSGAHLTSLRRTRVGDVRVANCWTIPKFEDWLQTVRLETTLPNSSAPKTFPTLPLINIIKREP